MNNNYMEEGEVDDLKQELEDAQTSLEEDQQPVRSVNCALLAEFDETVLEKEEEITQLRGQMAGAKQRLGGRRAATYVGYRAGSESDEDTRSFVSGSAKPPSCRGEVPPVLTQR